MALLPSPVDRTLSVPPVDSCPAACCSLISTKQNDSCVIKTCQNRKSFDLTFHNMTYLKMNPDKGKVLMFIVSVLG